ncbi:MAG: 2-oxo acid dehydrogenase subunit E2 [Hyphomicrobiaceae bacterium]
MKAFKMPSLGADMEGGTLVEWLKAPGDDVSRGDIVAVVETVKGAIEIECFDAGMMAEHVVEPGTTVTVGEVLAYLDGVSSDGSGALPRIGEPVQSCTVDVTPSPAPAARSQRISPAARKRAHELGIDIQRLGAGPGQVIGIAEVEAAAAAPIATVKEDQSESIVRAPATMREAMRQAIGRAMARSKREIPHYYVSSILDVTTFYEWFETVNAKRSVADRLLYAAPLLKATAIALQHTPVLNGTYEDGVHRTNPHLHVGVLTAIRGGGLVAPAIHDVDQLGLDQVMMHLRDLVARVRSGRIRGSEMSDPTVTVSILGEGTADTLQPVIYPPQVAIIGCGAVRERPWVVEGSVVIRRVMHVTVAGDHRVSDGRAAARFLNRLDAVLQEPETL